MTATLGKIKEITGFNEVQKVTFKFYCTVLYLLFEIPERL